jgi:hypothetical protein
LSASMPGIMPYPAGRTAALPNDYPSESGRLNQWVTRSGGTSRGASQSRHRSDVHVGDSEAGVGRHMQILAKLGGAYDPRLFTHGARWPLGGLRDASLRGNSEADLSRGRNKSLKMHSKRTQFNAMSASVSVHRGVIGCARFVARDDTHSTVARRPGLPNERQRGR